jgi:phosphate starvation-inducible PhoH-like protein
MAEKEIYVDRSDELIRLLGPQDRNLRLLEEQYGVDVVSRNGELKILGEKKEAVEAVYAILRSLLKGIRSDVLPDETTVKELINQQQRGEEPSLRDETSTGEGSTSSRVRFSAMTEGQSEYIRKMRENDIVFSIGPAGTGKTYLGVGCALEALWNGKVDRLVLCRPAVEAGEQLGYLPGDIEAKVNPYLRPLYDSLRSLLEHERLDELLSDEVVEIVPLAFMRGRTLDDAFIILDEGQNTTSDQMKMFLTRMGRNSQAVVTGDVTQIDLQDHKQSGLVQARSLLSGIDGIAFCELSESDIVRHPLVQEIHDAYDSLEP